VRRASDLLKESERTLPFEGVLRLTNVSESQFRTENLPGNPHCEGSDVGNLVTEGQLHHLPSSSKVIGKFETAKNFVAPQSSSIGGMTYVITEGSSIGPADGITYEIIYVQQVMRSAPECGFNDLGIPNMANYNAEARRYRNHVNGTLVNQWEETVYTFVSCYLP
jgi:hypothetical protein